MIYDDNDGTRNKEFTLVGKVLYCVPVLSSKLIGINVFVFLSFECDLNVDRQREF